MASFDIVSSLSTSKGFLTQSQLCDDPDKLLNKISSFIKEFFLALPKERSVEMEQDIQQVKTNLLDACATLQAYKKSVLKAEPKKEESKEDMAFKEYTSGTDVNLVCEAPTHLSCAGYRLGRIPYVGNYVLEQAYNMGYSIKTVRLHLSQLDNCPEPVKKALGQLEDKSIDFFFMINVCSMIRAISPDHYNLITHPWAIPHLKELKEKEDVTVFVEQGIFETEGVYPINATLGHDNPEFAGLAINNLGMSRIHCHLSGAGYMAISPDNARFGVPGDAPFSSFFSVTLLENRALVSFQVLIHDYEDPFCQLLQNTSKGIQADIPKLKQEARRLDEVQAKNITVEKFTDLPESVKNVIYGEIWILQGSPMGVDAQFGRKSFHAEESLDPKYHATDAQKALALSNYANKIKDRYQKLMQTLESLFVPPKKPFPVSDKKSQWIEKLAPIAAAFKQNEEDLGMFLFNELSQGEKNKIYGMTWEYFNCPMIDKFGELSFHGDKSLKENQRCEGLDRVYILNLAAHH